MSITGLPGQGPVRVGIPIADLSAGLYCSLGILVALLAREETGEGQWVQTSLLQAQIAMLDFQATRWLMDERGAEAGRQQPPDQHPDRRLRDRRRPHQHRRHRPDDLGALLPLDRPRGSHVPSRLRQRGAALEEPRRARDRDQRGARLRKPSRDSGSTASTRPACPAARSTPSTRCSPTRRSSISASRRSVTSPAARRHHARRPAGRLSDTPSAHRRAAARERRAHRRDPRRVRLRPDEIAAFRRNGTI